jgi:hypothetical protein
MIAVARYPNSVRAGLLALGLLAAGIPLSAAHASHNVYPRGWNTPETVGPSIYGFVVGGERMHRLDTAAGTQATQASR